MSEVNDSLQAAVANAADKIADADTIEEAQQWQSVISNLVAAQSQVGTTPVPVPENVATEPVSASVPPVNSFEDNEVNDPVQTTDETNTIEKE